jgi:hypothetical protein
LSHDKIKTTEENEMAYNESAKKAIMKYQQKSLDRVSVWVPKGTKAVWQAHAELMGESLTAFLTRAVMETMQRDRAKAKEAIAAAIRTEKSLAAQKNEAEEPAETTEE